MKKIIRTILACALVATVFGTLLAGCSSSPSSSASSQASSAASSSSAPDSSKPDAAAEKVVLAVSFGTSYDSSRDKTIGAIEKALQEAFPDYEVRRAFTSQTIIDILAEDGLEIDNVTQAMDRLVDDGVKEVIVQPTHVMNGAEYDDTIAEITPYADKFDSFKVGEPLLISDEDFTKVADVLVADTAEYNNEGTAIVFMGHGTHHEANATYAKMQQVFADGGHDNYFVGTVEADPTLEDVMALIEPTGATKVVLLPLMVVAGDHATNDMAGDEEDSWKTILTGAGYEVEAVLKGMGEYPGIQDIYVEHAKAAKAL